MKRHDPTKRGLTEQRFDSNRHYGAYIRDCKRGTSKINPIFTEKPHYGLEVGKK